MTNTSQDKVITKGNMKLNKMTKINKKKKSNIQMKNLQQCHKTQNNSMNKTNNKKI